MTAMFPDSGVPWTDARNSLPDPATVGCDELWYSTTRCQPRFDPAAANAMLAELVNLINKGEVTYNCNNLNQVELAARYIVQRGLARGSVLAGGPFNYTGALDPPITRYNDLMTLTIIPNANNQGAVNLDFGLGQRALLRNDGLNVKAQDLKAGRPQTIAFWGGYWFMIGLSASQVPLVATGAVDGWVRTDGNDITGDGTQNTPDRAFRTIQGAWNTIGSRYAASPLLSINIRLGLPGTYDGATIGPYGGNCGVFGDPNNRAAYRITTTPLAQGAPAGGTWGLRMMATNAFLSGINLVLNNSNPMSNASMCLRLDSGVYWLDRCQFTLETSNSGSSYMIGASLGCIVSTVNDCVFEGNGNSVQFGYVQAGGGGFYGNPPGLPPALWLFRNIVASQEFFRVSDQAVVTIGNMNLQQSNCIGRQYTVTTNGVFYRLGQTIPGSVAGQVGSQGQVF